MKENANKFLKKQKLSNFRDVALLFKQIIVVMKKGMCDIRHGFHKKKRMELVKNRPSHWRHIAPSA